MTPSFRIAEVFRSVQGEGPDLGRPATFVRLAGCPRACPWCDTDHAPRREVALAALLDEVAALGPGLVVLTGGEPLLQLSVDLVEGLRLGGFEVAIETNGTSFEPDAVRLAGLLRDLSGAEGEFTVDDLAATTAFEVDEIHGLVELLDFNAHAAFVPAAGATHAMEVPAPAAPAPAVDPTAPPAAPAPSAPASDRNARIRRCPHCGKAFRI